MTEIGVRYDRSLSGSDQWRRVGKAKRAHRAWSRLEIAAVGTLRFAHPTPRPCNSRRPQYPHETPAHALLRLGEMSVKRREIRNVGGAGEKFRQARGGGFGVEGRRDAQAQDLAQVLIGARCRP